MSVAVNETIRTVFDVLLLTAIIGGFLGVGCALHFVDEYLCDWFKKRKRGKKRS